MAEIELVIVPSLRSSSRKAADLIKSREYNMVFLNFPRNLQPLISELVSGRIQLSSALDRIKEEKLIPEPIGAWLYLNGPILEAITGINGVAEVYCYSDVDYHHMLIDVASKIANLTARAGATGKVDIEEWIRILKEHHMFEASRFEAETIGVRAEGRCLCLTGLSGWKLAEPIRAMGHKVKVRCVEKLYVFKPLEMLDSLIERGRIKQEEVEELIRCHINFVRSYILTSENLDEAYNKWIRNRHKIIIHRNEISKTVQT